MTGLRTDSQDLSDARESLSYWTQRTQRLPLRAVRKRREARMIVPAPILGLPREGA